MAWGGVGRRYALDLPWRGLVGGIYSLYGLCVAWSGVGILGCLLGVS